MNLKYKFVWVSILTMNNHNKEFLEWEYTTMRISSHGETSLDIGNAATMRTYVKKYILKQII